MRRRFGAWRGPDGARPPVRAPAPPDTRVVVVDKPDVTQSQVRIASAGFPRKSPDYVPGIVASALLGGGFTSRLMEAIRVNRGLSYGVRSRFATSASGGVFFVSTFTKVETTAEIVEVALDETARFCDEGPTGEELERTKSYLCGLFPLSLETHDQLAEKLADLALFDLPDDDVTGCSAIASGRWRRRSARLAARRYFPLERRVVVAVGPAKAIAPRARALRAGHGRPREEDGVSGGAGPPRVLHADAALLAVDKPAGRLVIPGRGGDELSLREELEAVARPALGRAPARPRHHRRARVRADRGGPPTR